MLSARFTYCIEYTDQTQRILNSERERSDAKYDQGCVAYCNMICGRREELEDFAIQCTWARISFIKLKAFANLRILNSFFTLNKLTYVYQLKASVPDPDPHRSVRFWLHGSGSIGFSY
jgi:hypothetical protein